MLTPLVGRAFDGATLTPVDEDGGLGAPALGPARWLRDLELRLGLPVGESALAVRIDRWSAKLAALAGAARQGEEPFYARSYAGDPIGTVTTLLSWRDALIEGGWDGGAIADGGPRLGALAALEALDDAPLPAGEADRLSAVERALVERRRDRIYDAVSIVGDLAAWPLRWRRVLALLAAGGTRVEAAGLAAHACASMAPAESDLGSLQRLLAAGETSSVPRQPRGDGSLLLIRAPTALAAADALAAILARHGAERAVIIRPIQAAILDESLHSHGLASCGVQSRDRWRGGLQLLPLALELAFAPPDPARVLELLGLSDGPFAPITRHILARALGDAPGIGGRRWSAAKQRLEQALLASGAPDAAERAARQLALIATWLEGPRHDPRAGATPLALRAVIARVRELLRIRLADRETDPVLATAFGQCALLDEIIARDPRPALDVVAMRQLVDLVGTSGTALTVATEACGRVDHVDHPGALLCARDLVAWWHFTATTAPLPFYRPWRRTELDALARAGVVPLDAATLLREDAADARRAVLAARRQLLLLVPETTCGEAMTPHPLWDEIVARMRLDGRAIARLVVSIDEVDRRLGIAHEALAPLPLPAARPAWRLPAGAIAAATEHTPSTLEHLLGCPLRWVLERPAGLRAGALTTLADDALLQGTLGHDLVQALVEADAFVLPTAQLEAASLAAFEALLPGSAAPLLQPGMSFEVCQLRAQLVRAVRRLAAVLARGELAIVAVEESISASWLDATVTGRLDLRLRDRHGRDVILDLKWGHTRYRQRLVDGHAVQLAVYAHATPTVGANAPAVGYFSLSRGRLLTSEPRAFGEDEGVDGPSTAETWQRVGATVPLIIRALAAGDVAVTGVRRSLPIVEALDIPSGERAQHYDGRPEQGCDFCGFGALCGRAWESLA